MGDGFDLPVEFEIGIRLAEKSCRHFITVGILVDECVIFLKGCRIIPHAKIGLSHPKLSNIRKRGLRIELNESLESVYGSLEISVYVSGIGFMIKL